jgi:hypothetical protein
MKLLKRVILGTFFLLSLTTTLVRAEVDPPGRVARLQYIAGSVSVQPRGADDWVAGNVNRPLTSADNVWADKDSRAELNLGTGILRLDSETSLTLTNISDNTIQLQLHQGTLNLRVRRLYGGEIYEIDTPNIAFTVQKSGEYRFDVGPNGDATLVTVWKGEGDATGDGNAVRVHAHQRARFTGGNSLAHELYEAPAYDGFDDWCRVRDQRQDHSYSARYVSPGVIGYEDLDEYGSWRVVPTYGSVWVPTIVTAGWAPYRYGHWVWVSPWGWTWVDDAPWGFAPFHYGRWVYYGGYWGWAPGPAYVRPVYAPALVAWFGGSNWGFGLAFGGGYGWCPLGYGEPFVPWYYGSRQYFRSVNVTNTRITNINYITNNYYINREGHRPVRQLEYANMKAPGALTAVPQRTLENSLSVSKNAIPVSAKDARDLGRVPIRGNVSLEPTRESRLGINAGRPTAVAPERSMARPVVSKINPPAAPERPEHSAPVRIAEERPLVSVPAPGRVIPRPPQSTGGRDQGTPVAHNVPKPPSAGGLETHVHTLPAQGGARPPMVGRNSSDTSPSVPAPRVSRNNPTQPADREPVSSSPAIRQVPRPPANETRPVVGPRETPRPQSGSVFDRTPEQDSPRPASAPPRGMGPDENRPRTMPGSPEPRGRSEGGMGSQPEAPAPRMSTPAPSSAPHASSGGGTHSAPDRKSVV